MKMTRRLYSPAAIRTRFVKLLEEIEELEGDEPDQLILAETLPEVIKKAGQQLLRGGFSELYERSLKLIFRIDAKDGVEYLPVANPVKTKSFLSECLAAVENKIGKGAVILSTQCNESEGASASPRSTRHGRLHQPPTAYAPPSHQNAYKQYKEAESVLGYMVSDFDAYKWLMGRYGHLPKYMNWERYVRGGRRFFKDNKNYPRAGRDLGGSVVHASEV